MNQQTAIEIWTQGNEAGRGYAVGEPDDSVNEIGGIGTLIAPAYANDGIAVYKAADGRVVLVGDANGPWAVDADRSR